MRRLNLEQLLSFLAVVRMGGVLKASSFLNVTQPAVTSRIKNLENTIGSPLFERKASGLLLTKKGELLCSYAKRLEHLLDGIERDVIDPQDIEGHLRLGASETIAQCWLPDFVTELHRRYPKIEIEFNVDISVNLRDGILSREIDLAFLLGPVSEYSVENVALSDVELAWFCAIDHSGAKFDKPVITYARNTRPYREMQTLLQEKFGCEMPIFPSSSLSACFRLVAAGLGIAALPRILGQDYLNCGQIREFDPGWVPNPLHFTAAYLGEPKSHVIETAAKLAQSIASEFNRYNKNL